MNYLKLKILHKLLTEFLEIYNPHHEEQLRKPIDTTKGLVYRHLMGRHKSRECVGTMHVKGCQHNENL